MKSSFENPSESHVIAELSALLSKPTDRSDDRNISLQDWFGVSTAVEREMRRLHGDERAEALHKHHMVVLGIASRWSWAIAVEYDIEQRELAFMDKSHDYSTIDNTSVAAIFSKQTLQSHRVIQPLHSPSKRRASEELSPASTKRQKGVICFRCGSAGHMPASCSASTTSAGKPVPALTLNARSNQALQAPSGVQYCFSFASRGACKFGTSCSFEHSCSLCRSSSHGAANCRIRN